MIIRIAVAGAMLIGAAGVALAAEESSTSGDRLESSRPGRPGRPTQSAPVARPDVRPDGRQGGRPEFRQPSFSNPTPPTIVVRPPPPPVYRRDLPPPSYGRPNHPPYSRPLPPPVVYLPQPPPRLGYTCETRRIECDLRRPRPLGSDCECETPRGFRPGVVRP